jgi:hypothetical protein
LRSTFAVDSFGGAAQLLSFEYIMKSPLYAVVFLTLATSLCHAQTELDDLEGKIRAQLRGTGWGIVKDWDSITVTKTNVQFLNRNQLPVLAEEELWKQYSFTSDYRITITFDTKLTYPEFEEILRVKRDLTVRRVAGLKKGWQLAEVGQEAQGLIRLPGYYSDVHSVYFYTTDDDDSSIMMRPDSVSISRDAIRAILEKSFSKYPMASEQSGAANGSDSETNRAPTADGSPH